MDKKTAKEYAIDCHQETNHRYGNNQPYSLHLNCVVGVALKFIGLVPVETRDIVLDACWCHDVIEDCRQIYNDVKNATSIEVAEIVYALTNEKGKNRAERANDKYYQGIRNTPYADFVKLCDRIANVEYSVSNKSSMVNAYKKENAKFIERIGNNYPDMIAYLNEIFKQSKGEE